MKIRLEMLKDGTWRASLEAADHIGGCGDNPEEAIGSMVFNHPQRCGITSFDWRDPQPFQPFGEVYPSGEQKPFDPDHNDEELTR